MPNMPLLLEESRPIELRPPTAPEERATAFVAPSAFTEVVLAVFMTVPVAAPAVAFAVDAAPPTRPPLRAEPCTVLIPAPESIISPAPEDAAADWADAIAMMDALNGICCPFFNTA